MHTNMPLQLNHLTPKLSHTAALRSLPCGLPCTGRMSPLPLLLLLLVLLLLVLLLLSLLLPSSEAAVSCFLLTRSMGYTPGDSVVAQGKDGGEIGVGVQALD